MKNILLMYGVAYPLAAALLLIPVIGAGSSYGGSYPGSHDSKGKGSVSADDCRFCHEDLDRFPWLLNTNTDKHHLLIGQEITGISIVPFQTSGTQYECLSCHSVQQTDVNSFEISVERDCLQCHPKETVTGSPRTANLHHTLSSYVCSDCHYNRGR